MNSNEATLNFFTKKVFERKENIVTIWGAGASINSGVPSGYYIMQKMIEDLQIIKESTFFRKKLGIKYDKVKNNLDSNTNLYFEYVLWIYGKIFGLAKLHIWLKQYIPNLSDDNSIPYFPSFSHEYFSHLTNSGFFKYIISTNFDEILESTFEDELGYGNFKIVASKSEFERLVNIDIKSWEKDYRAPHTQCFIFKPHGTISRRLTLRHTPKNVAHFEPEKQKVLIEILKNAIVVFVGFGNYNENFWLLFGETYSMGLTNDIIIIDHNATKVRKKLPKERLNSKIHEYNGKIDDFFKEIYNKQKQILQSKQTPARHYLRSLFFDLFSRQLSELKPEKEKEYVNRLNNLKKINKSWWYDLRIYELELLIYLFKSRGLFIQLAVSDCPRIVKAYSKCLHWKNKVDNSKGNEEIINIDLEPSKLLQQILNKKGNDPLIGVGNVIDRFNNNAINIFWCFLLLNTKYHANFKIMSKKESVSKALEKIFDAYCEEIATRYSDYLFGKIEEISENMIDNIVNNQSQSDFRKEFKEQIKQLYVDFDIDIVDRDISTSMRFVSPKLISNRDDFNQQTDDLLNNHGNELRVSTISAEWLTKKIKYFARNKNRKIEKEKIIILSNVAMFTNFNLDNGTTEIINLFHYQQMVYNITELIREIKKWKKPMTTIDWYAIRNLQHHMTIISKKEKNIRAIYFRREGKNAEISPVSLTNKSDVDSLTKYFDDRIESLKSDNNDCTSMQGGLLFNVKKTGDKIKICFNKESVLNNYEYEKLTAIMCDFLKDDKDISFSPKCKVTKTQPNNAY